MIYPGSGYGLNLVLNIEEYEYMKGPNTDAGLKVICIHIISYIIFLCNTIIPFNFVYNPQNIKIQFTFYKIPYTIRILMRTLNFSFKRVCLIG